MRVVSVFGGGGAKSLAHAGAWKALLEAGVRPSHIVGTSMGAVVGAAFAAGSTYQRFVEMVRSLGPKDVAALDRKSTRLNSSHLVISYAVFCLKKKKTRR